MANTMASGFDKTKHMPPRLDNKGLNIDPRSSKGIKTNTGLNILGSAGDVTKIPNWWQKHEKSNVNNNRTDMVQRRR